MPNLELKSFRELLASGDKDPLEFFIPDYQRGYRWTPEQVKALLQDIWDFRGSEPTNDQFYSLQPIVVKQEEIDGANRYRVIDGQQRLTTLHLIYRYFRGEDSPQIFNLTFGRGVNFSFQTLGFADKTELNFRDGNLREEVDQASLDVYFIKNAINTIKEWHTTNEEISKDNFRPMLANSSRIGPNIRFIWYQLETGDDEEVIFDRLNSGKIPLTNDELIRALFLKVNLGGDVNDRLQQQISNEWDAIQKKMEDDSFWYFLTTQTTTESRQSRMDLIFELFLQEDENPHAPLRTFYHFHTTRDLITKSIEDRKQVWDEVKKVFQRLESWFENREFFHLIGFINHNQILTLKELLNESEQRTKSEFKGYLKEKIAINLGEEARANFKEYLQDITYTPQTLTELNKVLLLFNLASLHYKHNAERMNVEQHESTNTRFQFDQYIKQRWDIEHIHSQAHDEQNDSIPEDQTRTYLALNQIEDTPEKRAEILDEFKKENLQDNIHGLGNLCLLDENTNRSYKNSPFAFKRMEIIRRDRHGIYIPLCTRNVFLKSYSQNITAPSLWTKDDAVQYVNDIHETVKQYLAPELDRIEA